VVGYHLPSRREMGASSLRQPQGKSHYYSNASVFISKKGLRLPQRISFDKWMGIGIQLCSICSSSAWCLGDWLVYGETAFEGRYREAIEQTSLDYQTLRNYAWVVRKFSLSRRRDKLSFGHHAEVAALSEPEQDFWLGKAEELAWTVKELRREVRTSLRERSASRGHELDSGPGQGTVTLKVPIPVDHLEACHAAASRCGLNVDEWASQVLMQVALTGEPG
jgi:hypothetical protein